MAIPGEFVPGISGPTVARGNLLFNPETITMVVAFGDELSPRRARAKWQDLLRSHFLLDPERDFELKIAQVSDFLTWELTANMAISACGRYAFWRLINGQAPETELKFQGVKPQTSGPLPGSFTRLKQFF